MVGSVTTEHPYTQLVLTVLHMLMVSARPTDLSFKPLSKNQSIRQSINQSIRLGTNDECPALMSRGMISLIRTLIVMTTKTVTGSVGKRFTEVLSGNKTGSFLLLFS